MISAVQASSFQPPSMVHIPSSPPPRHVGMVQLLTPPNPTPIVPPVVDSTIFEMTLRQSGLMMNTNASVDDTRTLGNDFGTILVVNGSSINLYIYDANGHRII